MPEPAEEPEVVAEKPVPESDEEIELDHAPVAPVLPFERRMRDDALLAMIADPRVGWHSATWMDGSVLRVGMLHRRGAGVSRDMLREARDLEEPNIDRAERGGRDVNRTIDFEPSAAITRGQLMEELLREASGHGVL